MLYGSNDYGATWTPKQHLPFWMDECAIAPLPRSRIAMTCRTNNLTKGRVHFTLEKGGRTYSRSDAALLDPACQGSVVYLDNTLFVSHVNRNDGSRYTLSVSR